MRRRLRSLLLGLLTVLIVLGGWLLAAFYHQVRLESLNRLLFAAVDQAQDHEVEAVIHHEGDPDAIQTRVAEETAQTVETLLDQGADPNATNIPEQPVSLLAFAKHWIWRHPAPTGPTPILIEAIQKYQPEAALNLVRRGASANSRNASGDTPLMEAAEQGTVVLLKALLDKGAQVNTRDNKGATALMYASWSYKPEMSQVLLERGADLNAANNDGETVLDYALRDEKNPVAPFLIERGAKKRSGL